MSEGKDKYFDKNPGLLSKLKEDNRFSAVSESLDSSGFIFYNDESYPVLMRGFDLEEADDIYKFDEKLIEGNLPSSSMEIILGKNLIEEMGVSIGENINMVTPEGNTVDLKLVGIYDFKVASLNKSWIITEITTSEQVFDKVNRVSSIETQIKDVFQADLIADEISLDIKDSDLGVTNWKAQNEELLSGLVGQSASSYMIQVFVLLAVLLGITSVLAISVVQKSKQLGILKAMGIKDKDASLIFLFQGLILGVIGSIIGTILGIGLTFVFSNFVKNPDGSPLIPFYLDYAFVGISVIIAIISATLAAFVPARKSSKLNPIEVIKNG
jgi:lipoprotein-releasing system permease protein